MVESKKDDVELRPGGQQIAHAQPEKAFFVSMLTRDIELLDAILDLLDNCVDGILRTIGDERLTRSTPYESFSAAIEVSANGFSIADNCGGIPRHVAINSAFRMGRPATTLGAAGTVGRYGIGMKRAIFKMGNDAVVRSTFDGDSFRVDITPEWMRDPGDWDLPLTSEKTASTNGTRIEITDLHPAISSEFQRTTFVEGLKRRIGNFYALILDKGFVVTVNGDMVKPQSISWLIGDGGTRDTDGSKASLDPFVLKATIDKVDVLIVAGFSRPTPSPEEVDSDERSTRAEDAGWTVACNDRIVLFRDRSEVTGWGTYGVPSYHNQFSSIAGVVLLTSDDTDALPFTTTKRGLDGGHPVFIRVREQMQRMTRQLVTFTNEWKTFNEDRHAIFESATRSDFRQIVAAFEQRVTDGEVVAVREISGGRVFRPELPKPRKETTGPVRMSFSRPREEVLALALALFEDEGARPSRVAEQCFADRLDNVTAEFRR